MNVLALFLALQPDDPIVTAAWQLLLATGLIGLVTSAVFQFLKVKAIPWINKQNALFKQFLVLIIAQGLAWLGRWTGVEIPVVLQQIDLPSLTALLSAGFGMGFYEVVKAIKKLFKKEG